MEKITSPIKEKIDQAGHKPQVNIQKQQNRLIVYKVLRAETVTHILTQNAIWLQKPRSYY